MWLMQPQISSSKSTEKCLCMVCCEAPVMWKLECNQKEKLPKRTAAAVLFTPVEENIAVDNRA